MTDRGHVISDLYTVDLTGDVAVPVFRTPFIHVAGDGTQVTQGYFYYLGFSHNFSNGYVDTGRLAPTTPRFRVGLRHGSAYDPDTFARFRLRLEDGEGTNLLGYDAISREVGSLYAGKVLVLGSVDGDPPRAPLAAPGAARFSSLAQSSRLSHPAAAVWQSPATRGYWAQADAPVIAAQAGATTARHPLLFSNLLARTALGEGELYAEPPDHIYDLPPDLFDREDTRYTLTAWAEDAQSRPISPRCRLTFGTQVGLRGERLYTNVQGYDAALGANRHDTGATHEGPGRVLAIRLYEEDCGEVGAERFGPTPTPAPPPPSAPVPTPTPVPTSTPVPLSGTLSLTRSTDSSDLGAITAAWTITGTCSGTITVVASPSGGSDVTRTVTGTSGSEYFNGILLNNNATTVTLNCGTTVLSTQSI